MLCSRWAALAMITGLLFSGPAFAQETGVTGELERIATTSPQEKIQYATNALVEMQTAVKSVTKLVEAARKEGDVEKLQCLNNRMTAIRALLQVSEAANTAMNTALESGQKDRADHEFRKIAVALDKTRQLVAEAERCTSEAASKSGDTIIRVEGPLTEGGDDTAPTPFDELELGFDPPEASPYM